MALLIVVVCIIALILVIARVQYQGRPAYLHTSVQQTYSCPRCHSTTEAGYVSSSGRLPGMSWNTSPNAWRGGRRLGKGFALPSWLCASCGMILVDVSAGPGASTN